MENDTHSFIVRIWHEEDPSGEKITSWRGSIEQVGNDKRLYFYDLQGIIRFIREQTGIQSDQPPSWWQSLWSRLRHEFSIYRK